MVPGMAAISRPISILCAADEIPGAVAERAGTRERRNEEESFMSGKTVRRATRSTVYRREAKRA